MLRNRKGVTLVEIMTVVVVSAVVMAIVFPSMKDTRRASAMQSARSQVESYLAVARSVAIRNGVRAFLIREGNTIRIMADSVNGTIVTVVRPIQLDSVSNVTLGATKDTIIYDARGFAVNLSASGERFYITVASGYGAGATDSICVTRLGLVLDRKCGLSVAYKPPIEDLPPVEEEPIVTDPKDGGIIMDPTPIVEPIVEPIVNK
jgi:prepilin-type N-terminal cleavage/methylation domain-containing protein